MSLKEEKLSEKHVTCETFAPKETWVDAGLSCVYLGHRGWQKFYFEYTLHKEIHVEKKSQEKLCNVAVENRNASKIAKL